jgi:hypothetical protein
LKTTWSSAGRQSFKAGKEQPGCLLASAVAAAARKSNLIFLFFGGQTLPGVINKLFVQKFC